MLSPQLEIFFVFLFAVCSGVLPYLCEKLDFLVPWLQHLGTLPSWALPLPFPVHLQETQSILEGREVVTQQSRHNLCPFNSTEHVFTFKWKIISQTEDRE